jgi:DUF3054 family protein
MDVMTTPAGGRSAALVDALALVVFISIGIATHDAGFTVREISTTAIPFLGAWFLVAWALALYRRPRWPALVATWLIAIPVGAVVRSALRGGPWDDRLLVFASVALAFGGLFVAVGHVALGLLGRARQPSPSARGG